MKIPPLYWFIFATLLMHATHIFGQKDKALHFGAGATVGAWGTMTVKNEGYKPLIAGIGWATLAGIGKETLDKAGFGTYENKDIAWMVIGGIVGSGIVYFTNKLIHGRHRHRAERNI